MSPFLAEPRICQKSDSHHFVVSCISNVRIFFKYFKVSQSCLISSWSYFSKSEVLNTQLKILHKSTYIERKSKLTQFRPQNIKLLKKTYHECRWLQRSFQIDFVTISANFVRTSKGSLIAHLLTNNISLMYLQNECAIRDLSARISSGSTRLQNRIQHMLI